MTPPEVPRPILMQHIHNPCAPRLVLIICHAQVLVVSVTGTPSRADGVSFIDDFVEAALFAKQAGQRQVDGFQIY